MAHGQGYVRADKSLTSQDDLGRHPRPCAGRCHLAEVVLAHERGEAHIRDLSRAVARNEDIAGLQVQVHNPARHPCMTFALHTGMV